jgi:hypothetical protein
MNTEEQIDDTITSLKIIAMVQKNGRLCIRKGQLAIEPDDRIQAIRRWFNRDSRDQILLHLRICINNAVKLSRAILHNQIDVELKPWTLQRLLAEMTNSQHGLINLKTTYCNDPAMVAAIDVLIERLHAHCNELQPTTTSQTASLAEQPPKKTNSATNTTTPSNTKHTTTSSSHATPQ